MRRFNITNKIELTQSFLDLFGFYKTSISSTRQADDTYIYDLSINGINITNSSQAVAGSLDYFEGNAEKNAHIKTGPLTNQQKYALLIAKELGDVLQIIYIFILLRQQD